MINSDRADVLEESDGSYGNPPNSPVKSQPDVYAVNMKEVCERLTEIEKKLLTQETDIDNMRTAVRRLRFANDLRENRYRRDCLFFDSTRRRFLQFWDGNPAVFNAIPSAQMAMLLVLLDFQRPLNL